MKDRLQKLVGRSQLKQAIELLLEYAPTDDLKAAAIQLQQKLTTLQRNQNLGLINFSEAGTEQSRITYAILALGTDVEDQLNNPTPPPQINYKVDAPNSPAPNGKPKGNIYFSYAWGTNEATGKDREDLVNKLYVSLSDDGFNVKRDKMDLDYGGLISDFMEDIGEGDLVVIFMSEKYAKSPYCMNELYLIAQDCKWDKQLFVKRTLPVNVEFINFAKPSVKIPYLQYWKDQKAEWDAYITEWIDEVSNADKKKHEYIKEISRKFSELTAWYSDVNASTNALLSEDDFAQVKEAILKRLG
ncbi:MAG: TIR domain-containing protein [Bacteroidota bacterium]